MVDRTQRRVLAVVVLAGAAVAAVGAVMASAAGVWGLGRAARIEHLSGEALGSWIWGNILLGTGIAVIAAGVAALSGMVGSGFARAGGALAVMAGAVAVIGFLFQGVGGAEAAELLAETGEIPDGFFVTDAIQDGLLVLFGGLMSLGTAGVGFGSLNVDWLPRGVGATAGSVSIASLAMLPLNIPFMALLGSLALAGGLLLAPTRTQAVR